MSLSTSDFWKLLAESRLLATQQVRQLAAEFAKVKQTAEPTAKTVAQWLLSRQVLSRYQALILLAGRPGPFIYGDYRVYDRVEKGRAVGCFRAVHAATGHPVLLYFLTGPVITDPRLWSAAAHNVMAASAIVSPHVERYFEPVDLQKFKFIVGEDCRGSALDELLSRGRCPPPEACRLMRLAAVGLAAMHARGRTHGDLRPGNILVEAVADQPANAKLLYNAHESPAAFDFVNQAADGRLALAADFLAPELVAAGRTPDALTDIYALGCTLYTLLAGAPPFSGGTIQEKLTRHAVEPIRPLDGLGVPKPLGQLVAYVMAKNPASRYQSAQLVAEQLAMFVEPAALRVEPPAPPATLASFEQSLRQKQAQQTSEMPAAVPVVAPQAGPINVQQGQGHFSGLGSDAAAVAVATQPTLGIQVGAKSRGLRSADEILKRRLAKQKRNQLVGAVCAALLAIGGGVGFGIWWKNQPSASTAVARKGKNLTNVSPNAIPSEQGSGETSIATTAVNNHSVATNRSESGSAAAKSEGSLLVADDGKTLWASPTHGEPVSFRCVPPEGQVFVIVRPSAMLGSDEGQRVLTALGPTFAAQRAAWEAASGVKFEEIEQLHITLHNNDAKFPRASFVVKTKEAIPAEQLLGKWGNPEAAQEKSQTYYAGPVWSYYVSSAPEDARTFAMGEARDMKDVAAAAGAPPVVFREIERLRRATDADRHFTMLFFPQFLFNDDGQPLFAGERAKVRQPLEWLLGDQLQAASVSGHFADAFYFELRLLGSLDKEPYQMAQELHERLDKVPMSLENYFDTLNPPMYWKRLAGLYPLMVRNLESQLRIGVENDQAIINSFSPASAAHNLVLGGELLVATAPGQAVVATANDGASGPQTIAESLQVKTSYSFDSQSLEFAMRDLADEVKSNLKNVPFEFVIKIIGDDLKLEGITRNQSIRDFKQENQPVADILTALVRKANPVTTVKDPSEKDQKLVWLIGPDPDNPGKQVILITTRAAAATKKYTLPVVFMGGKS